MKKDKIIHVLTDFNSAISTIHTHQLLIRQLARNFDTIIFINILNFQFLNKKKKNTSYLEKKYSNIKFISFKRSKEFFNYFEKIENKIAINNFGKKFQDFYMHYLVKRSKIRQFKVLTVDLVSQSLVFEKKHFFKKFLYFLNNKFSSYIVNVLVGLNIFNKIDICFTTNKNIFNNKKKMGYIRDKFSFYNKVILVNSTAYDMCFEKKIIKSDKHILYIDYMINHMDNLSQNKKINEEQMSQHYLRVNKFLNHLKIIYKKKIVVSIGPQYSINFTKKFLRGYKVYKNKTFDLIKNSEIIALFNSTSINPAFIMKKKIIFLSTKQMGVKPFYEFNMYPRKSGSPVIDIDRKVNFSKYDLNKKFNRNKKRIEAFTAKYLSNNQQTTGYNTIINEIKRYV